MKNAIINDPKAILTEIVEGISKKNGRPYRIAKFLFTGTGKIVSAFCTDDAAPLPPIEQPVQVQIPIKGHKDINVDGLCPFWDSTAKFAVSPKAA